MTAQPVRSSSGYDKVPLTSQFVGRQRELELIWNQYEAARGGSARIVLMVGELGIGKTRLLDEMSARAMQDGAIVLRGSASEAEGMPPYLPFLEALGKHIRTTPPGDLHEQISVAPQALASILPELAVHLGELPVSYPSPPEQARLRLYESVGTFLKAISEPHALVLTIDDFHWADTASLDLLCHIMRQQSNAQLLVLCTCREGEIGQNSAIDRAVHELTRQRVLTTVAVNPLSAEEIEALAVSYIGGPISPGVSRLLQAQSEGNPFFAEEILRCWIEMGTLIQKDRQWDAVMPLEHTLPSSIVGALRQRFARLSTFIIDHLRIAAVIGRTFNVSLLAAVEGQEVEPVEEIILEAVHAGLVRVEQTGLFTFSHDKIRETLYAEVSASRRRRLHGIIGQALEAHCDQDGVTSILMLAELAFHFSQSGDRKRGVNYSLLAAEQALRSFATDKAIVYYHTALELLDSNDARRGPLLLDLGRAALLLDDDKEAEAAYTEALDWFLQRGEQETAARAVHGLGIAQWRQEALQAAREKLEYALVLLKHPSTEAVRVLVNLSILLTVYIGQQAEGCAFAEQALAMAQRLGDRSLNAAASRAVAVKLYVSGDNTSDVLWSMEQALAIAQESDDANEAAECCLYLEGAYYRLVDMRRSHEINLLRTQFIESYRYPYQLRYSYTWPALLFSSQGKWGEAELAIEQAQPIVDRLTSPAPLAFLHQVRGFLAYQREDYLSAECEFQAARVNQPREPSGLIYTGLLGLTQIALSRQEEAYTYMTELEALLAELPPGTVPTAPIMTCLALMAIALDDQERVTNLYLRLLIFRGQHYWFLVDRVLGEMATLCKDWEMAMTHLSAAEASAKREDLRPELARILVAQANFHTKRGGKGSITQAKILLRQALVLFEELNLVHAVKSTQQQLRRLSSRSDTSIPPLPFGLTRGEAKVLHLVTHGKSNRQIAKELGISEKTVANHLSHIFSKTASENRAAAAAFAIRHRLA